MNSAIAQDTGEKMSQQNVWLTDAMMAYAVQHKSADETISRYLGRKLKDVLRDQDPQQGNLSTLIRDGK